MITRVDPPDFDNASTLQIDSDECDPWLAIDEIENWAAMKGFVRTSEYQPRQVLVEGRRRFRAICYRVSDEERAAVELAQRQMIERGDQLRGMVHHSARGRG
jgi:hypothetical protein